MNARLKQLTAQRGMDPGKVQSLIDLHGGDEAWVERIILGADMAQKSAMASGVAYKVTGDAIDQAIERLRSAATTAAQTAGDSQIADQIIALAEQLAPAQPAAATKSSTDPFLAWFAGPPSAAKSFDPARDIWATALGADHLGRKE